jgi:hypothetical protein
MGNSSKSKTKKVSTKTPEKVSSQKKLQKNQDRVPKPPKKHGSTLKVPWSNQYGNSVTGTRAKKDKK